MFLDGTWSTVRDNTNIWRLRALCAQTSKDGAQQVAYYDQGVGTRLGEQLRGGILGYGLDRSVVSAYRWLIETYAPGDDVLVFGFSRGAFTARSLTGLIAKCGLLQPGAPLSIEQVFERYRQGKTLRPIYQLEYERRELRRRLRKGGSASDRPAILPNTRAEDWLLAYSQRIPIEFTGVFDTVGSLGIPFGDIPGLSSHSFQFHQTRLSNIYKQAYQALAIDEHRRHFNPTLWTKFTPRPPESGARASKAQPKAEQRWFVGAHANVGGGYLDNRLSQVPLAWLVNRAAAAGLAFRYPILIDPGSHLDPVVDSYSQFAYGLYKIATRGREHHRMIGSPTVSVPQPPGLVDTVNETIDGTVFDRWRADRGYRPPSVVAWATRRRLDPAKLEGVVQA